MSPLERMGLRPHPEPQVLASRLNHKTSPLGDVVLQPCLKQAHELIGELMAGRHQHTLASLQARTSNLLDGNEHGEKEQETTQLLERGADVVGTDSQDPMASQLDRSPHPPQNRVNANSKQKT